MKVLEPRGDSLLWLNDIGHSEMHRLNFLFLVGMKPNDPDPLGPT